MSRLVSVIGDGNVIRNMTALNIASREAMKNSQVIECSQLANLDASLTSVRAESTVCIVASITEFLLASGDCGTLFSTIDPVLSTFYKKMLSFCTKRPDLQVRISCLCGFMCLVLLNIDSFIL